MPSPLTPVINKALTQKNQVNTQNAKPGTAQLNSVPSAPYQPGQLTPTAGSSPPMSAANKALLGPEQSYGSGLSPANQQMLAPGNQVNQTGLGDTTGTGAQPFLDALAADTPAQRQALQQAYDNEQAMASVIGGPAAQQQLSDASAAFQQGLAQNALTGIESNANIAEQQAVGNENILQQQEANQISQQQLGLQEKYNPQLYAITQQQQALQGRGLGLQQEGIQQQAGEAGNTLKQALLGNYSNEATSGAVGTFGTKNAYAQDQYQYQQQIENLLRQGKQVGLQQEGLGLSEKQSAIQEAETKASYGISQEQIDNTAQRIGFDTQDLTRRIDNAKQALGISQNITTEQLFQAMADVQAGIPNQLSAILPYIASTGNYPAIPGVTVPASGTGATP
jgi:hypothetical protein